MAEKSVKLGEVVEGKSVDQRDREFKALLDELAEFELKYKKGDVDRREALRDDPAKVRWFFEEELDELDKQVEDFKDRLLEEHPAWYFKFLAIQSEAKNYFDTATPTYLLDLYTFAQNLCRELPKQIGTSGIDPDKERIVIKNKIRVIISGLEYLYRIGDFATAIKYAQELYEFVIQSGLQTNENKAHGTLAVIYNFLGRALRRRGLDDDYQQAIDYFYKCSESYYEMARRRAGNQEADVIYARTRAMVSLAFGAGFLFYNTQSDLVRAKALIGQARLAFLRNDGTNCCELHYNYLELLYASILRAEAGELIDGDVEIPELQLERKAAEEKLLWAKQELDKCGEVLRHKPKYAVQTLYNKGLICLYLGSQYYDEASGYITDLLTRSQDNPRWLANGLILRSHLERRHGNFDRALDAALRAYQLAGSHQPVRIESLLARGQAQLARKQIKAARSDFEKALELINGANLKQTTMAHLLLVEVAIAEQKIGEAYELFARAKSLMPQVSHGFIRNKFRQLSERLGKFQSDFSIRASEENLDYKHHDSELQRWLLEKALREDRNLTRAAERINVTKKTIYLWMSKHNIKA